MKADVEKVITMSLTKMAESRGLRRGGTSLHKHLLISSVLTKARTAYMDAWCTVDSSGNTAEISLHSRPSGAPKLLSSEPLTEEEEATLLDSRSLFQLDGTEMDLPRDILNCVEKMGGIPDDVGFNLRGSVITEDEEEEESEEERRTTAELILADFVDGLDSVDSPSKSFTYLDLDQSSAEVNISKVVTTSERLLGEGQPEFSTPKSKRRREWNFNLEEDEEDEDEEDSVNDFPGSSFLTTGHTKRFRFALSENYTFRATCDSKENTIPAGTSMLMSISTTTNYNSSVNRTPLEPFFTFKGNNFNFRTKKSQFEETEEDAAEDSPFLFEEDDEDCDEYGPVPCEKKKRNDRRVPSSNGSCSSSDEEQCGEDPAMDVDLDKITNLVQYISFNKGSGGGGGTGLVRSISTPDLFSCTTKPTSPDLTGDTASITSSAQINTKDLYTSCFTSHARYHQRVLTMKV